MKEKSTAGWRAGDLIKNQHEVEMFVLYHGARWTRGMFQKMSPAVVVQHYRSGTEGEAPLHLSGHRNSRAL